MVEGDELGPGQEKLGELADENPDPVLGGGLQGKFGQAGVLCGADAVLAAGPLAVTELESPRV